MEPPELIRFEVECVRSHASKESAKLGRVGYNARFHLRGLASDTAPRGVIALTRLPFEPKVGQRYEIRLWAAG